MTASVSEGYALLSEGGFGGQSSQIKSSRIGVTDAGLDLLLGIDGEGRHHFLFPAELGDTCEDRKSRHVQLLPRSLVLPSGVETRFADLVCDEPTLYGVFDALVSDMLEALQDAAGSPVDMCLKILSSWRELFSGQTGTISHRAEQGLLCELLVLLDLARISPRSALEGWDGPSGASRDFNHGRHSIEVKSVGTLDGTNVRVSNIEQLDPAGLDSLGLVVMHLRPAAFGVTVDMIASQVLGTGVDRLSFLGKLRGYGYSYGDSPARGFEVLSRKCWDVGPAFPSLRRADIPIRLQTAVSNLTYDVALPPLQNSDDEARYQLLLRRWLAE